ncbi:hypothetical protein VTO42DRAFT_4962 [Malbranchea cinnamomea]
MTTPDLQQKIALANALNIRDYCGSLPSVLIIPDPSNGVSLRPIQWKGDVLGATPAAAAAAAPPQDRPQGAFQKGEKIVMISKLAVCFRCWSVWWILTRSFNVPSLPHPAKRRWGPSSPEPGSDPGFRTLDQKKNLNGERHGHQDGRTVTVAQMDL